MLSNKSSREVLPVVLGEVVGHNVALLLHKVLRGPVQQGTELPLLENTELFLLAGHADILAQFVEGARLNTPHAHPADKDRGRVSGKGDERDLAGLGQLSV